MRNRCMVRLVIWISAGKRYHYKEHNRIRGYQNHKHMLTSTLNHFTVDLINYKVNYHGNYTMLNIYLYQ